MSEVNHAGDENHNNVHDTASKDNCSDWNELSDIRIVLVRTSHPGNIGAAARAMKTMGLKKMVLVSPKHYPDARATERASGASDILANAKVVDTLAEGIADCRTVIGATARQRTVSKDIYEPIEAAHMLKQADGPVAIVFGNERTGLENHEIAICNLQLTIPTAEEYQSLNLAAAVQVVCFSLRHVWFNEKFEISSKQNRENEPATSEEVLGAIDHIERAMIATKFLNPAHPKRLILRVKHLLQRAKLSKVEVNILRGFATSVCSGTFADNNSKTKDEV